MDINRLGGLEILGDYRQTQQRLTDTLDRLATSQRASKPGKDPVLWQEVEGLRAYVERLSGFSDNLNRGAASVEVSLSSMEAARSHLGQLEKELRTAFAEPSGSPARTAALKTYNELHRYVDDTARAPDPGARRLLSDPAEVEGAGDVEIRAGDNGFMLRLRSREIHTGAEGLNLPRAGEPPPSEREKDPQARPLIANIEQATDEEIEDMIRYLESAKEDLAAKQNGLALDARAIEDAQDLNEAFVSRNQSQAEALSVPDLNAEAVLAQSMQLKNTLALNGLAGLNGTRELALQLLRP